ncbi:MAG: hypothetical protein Q8L24_01020 [bacterium]|nr:hypothetical protein [bacterium]
MKKPYGFKEQLTTMIFLASCILMSCGLVMFIVRDPKVAIGYFTVGAIIGVISGIVLENLLADEEEGRLPEKKSLKENEP